LTTVSEHFSLGRTQPTLDFVDVPIDGDLRVFIDPRALRLFASEWGAECISSVQSFFRAVLKAIHEDRHDDAQRLLRALREPNETRLGLSRGQPRGRALGPESAISLWDALRQSEAVRSGLLEDLEDTILMVAGISSDIVSDITTNLIREPLIRYTQDACVHYGIPMDPDVDSGPLWVTREQRWTSTYVTLPVAAARKLLLVPKAIVRRRMDYNSEEYYNNYILEHLREEELNANTQLVRLLKSGVRRVSKKDLRAKYGSGKAVIVRETLRNPDLLQAYRHDKRDHVRRPLTHEEIAEEEGTPGPDWDALLANVLEIAPGRETADAYEMVVEALLTAIFYPALSNPVVQHEIHEGRKRIDIAYTNAARQGFFYWLALHYPAANVFVECKNFAADPANPELDQLAGRFSPSRGSFGLLVCRRLDNKDLFIRRCIDTAHDARGFIVPLDDVDLRQLVEERRRDDETLALPLIRERFDGLIM
jgi:hypothetical protein